MRHFIDASINFGDVNSSIVWLQMTPDTSLDIIKNLVAKYLAFMMTLMIKWYQSFDQNRILCGKSLQGG